MDEGSVEITKTQTQQNINQFLSTFNGRKEGKRFCNEILRKRDFEWNKECRDDRKRK